MPTIQDLCTWLRHNAEDLRLTPDMVTPTVGATVRIRWHELAHIGGVLLGVGVELRSGPCLGEIWLYGHGARQIRVSLDDAALVPPALRDRLRRILLNHVGGRVCRPGPSPEPWRIDAVA